MSEFNYYTTKEVYGETFFQLPKIFFTNDHYKKLSLDAKVAYAILRDRFNYSIKNNWVDENDRIFFIYTNKELGEILDCSNKTVVKIKKELEEKKLLTQKRVGINTPNKLYIGKPIANAQDVYLQKNSPQTLDNNGSVKSTLPENSPQTLDNSGSVKSTLPENSPQTLDNSGSVKSTHNLYKELTTDTYKDTVIDTTKEELQNHELLRSFSKTQDQTFLDKRCLELISLFSNTIQEAHNAVGIIIRAKNKQEKKYGRVLIAEDWQEEIENTLRKVYHKIKTDANIKNIDNYMFGAFCTTFENCLIQLQSRETERKSHSVITLHDWVEGKE
ncbi:replication initiator protein A [Enterococcus faecalis]|uniref:replication initiator protein A n=1 Tax=Enterococcus faecalis TaxID=1351 RepID=UPI002DBA5DB9|nr:replication initiator protein A [Enterococcus faecalis]MEB5927597.1 replication initiator protein A [Enterococcus faecalis]